MPTIAIPTLLTAPTTRMLIDPGHQAMFDHADTGLRQLGRGIINMDLVICTLAHPDQLEA